MVIKKVTDTKAAQQFDKKRFKPGKNESAYINTTAEIKADFVF